MTAPDTLPPELAELGELLREDPPRPDPAWARELDTRAAAGFPRLPRRSPWTVLRTHRRVLVPAVSFACVALLVAGLSTVTSRTTSTRGARAVAAAAARRAAAARAPAPARARAPR